MLELEEDIEAPKQRKRGCARKCGQCWRCRAALSREQQIALCDSETRGLVRSYWDSTLAVRPVTGAAKGKRKRGAS